MDDKEITETLSSASAYLTHLKCLETEIKCAEDQIQNTFKETKENIRQTFSNLKNSLLDILNKREQFLIQKAEETKSKGIIPLELCHQVILDKIENTCKLIKLGDSLVNGSSNGLSSFRKDSSLLGSLPEVPELKEVPSLSFQFESSSKDELIEICSNFGEISPIAPVQIWHLEEKPGGILVQWSAVDNDDRYTDIQEFRMQRAFGDVLVEKHLVTNFVDCYKGLDSHFLVKDLQVSQPYSFRICCKFEGTTSWSPWSLPQIGLTTLQAFSWSNENGYSLSSENRIATPLSTNVNILYSDGPQFGMGHSVEFTILDLDKTESVLGLTRDNTRVTDIKLTTNSFLLDSNGSIFIDGVEKATKLPVFTKGLKICFACESISNNKVRVNIDSDEKRVTYDWLVDVDVRLFFACQFGSMQWKIMIE